MGKKDSEHKPIEEVAKELVEAHTLGAISIAEFLRKFSLDCAKYSKYNSKNRVKYTELVIEYLTRSDKEKED